MCLAGHSVFDAPIEGVWVANRHHIAFVHHGRGNALGRGKHHEQCEQHSNNPKSNDDDLCHDAPPTGGLLVTRSTCNG